VLPFMVKLADQHIPQKCVYYCRSSDYASRCFFDRH